MTSSPIHPQRIRVALACQVSDATVGRLLGCHRLQRRIDNLFEFDRTAADMVPAWLVADPVEAARRAGSVMYAHAIRRILAGPEVTALVASIGREAHGLGLRLGAQARPRDHDGDLAQAIRQDGMACLTAWLKRQPDQVRTAILLALPPGTAIEEACKEEGTHGASGPECEAVMEAVVRSYDHPESAGSV